MAHAPFSGAQLSREDVLNVPFRLAEALRQDGWIHRSTLIWDKGSGSAVANSDATPECHEYVLHMIKWSSNKRRPYGNTLPLKSSVLRHHAAAHPKHGCVFPISLIEELLSVCPETPVILDPYIGSGTVAIAAKSVPDSTVYGFDLNCSSAREAVPEAACYTSSRLRGHTRDGAGALGRNAARITKGRPQVGGRVRSSVSTSL